MRERPDKPAGERELDALLQSSLPELPPNAVARAVTPCTRAMDRVLIGLALRTLTLNFLCLNHILPAVGFVLSLLGLRTLRRENRWFAGFYGLTIAQFVLFAAAFVLQATIWQDVLSALPLYALLQGPGLPATLLQLLCLRQGLAAVQRKAGLPVQTGSATVLLVWYAGMLLLALAQYQGLVLGLALVLCYILILRSLLRLSHALDEAGYVIRAAPVRIPDKALACGLAAALVLGAGAGYLFGNSYPMDWAPRPAPGAEAEAEAVRAGLLALGCPDYVLDDLTEADLLACRGALRVVVDVSEEVMHDDSLVMHVSGAERAEPVRELRITGVAVELPGAREQWKIIHHFQWLADPGFYGTESIQLWPAYRLAEGWAAAGEATGQVLYDRGGTVWAAPYYSLGAQTYTSDSLFWGEQTSTDLFAAFSLPRGGENQRGYVSYTVAECADGWILNSWVNYTHQLTWLQYPVRTAMAQRMEGGWNRAGAFLTVQDALQFDPADPDARPFS